MNYKLTTGFSDAFTLIVFCLISFKVFFVIKSASDAEVKASNFFCPISPNKNHPAFWKQKKPPKMVPDGCPITLVPIALSSSAPSVACVAAKRFG